MKIPALRIELNGELVAVAGAPELSLLTGQLGFGAGKNRTIDASQIMLSVMGLAVDRPKPLQLTWCTGVQLKLGDRVTFEITEVEHASEPDQGLRTPSTAELAAAAAKDEKARRARKD